MSSPEPAPEAYRIEYQPRYTLIWIGVGVFGFLYGTSVMIAALSSSECLPYGGCGIENSGPNYDPLYIPVVGPFLMLDRLDESKDKQAMVFDGLGQAAGLALIAVGILHKREKRVPLSGEGLRLRLAGTPRASGIVLEGTW